MFRKTTVNGNFKKPKTILITCFYLAIFFKPPQSVALDGAVNNKQLTGSNQQNHSIEEQVIAKPTNTSESQNPVTLSSTLPRESRFSAGEELIVTLKANSLELTNIFIIKSERDFRIGLGDFLQVIEFPIYVDLQQVKADGWYFNEQYRFALSQLNDGRLEVRLNDDIYYVANDDYALQTDDLYIEVENVIAWFDFTYSLNEERLILELKSDRTFPAEQRIARQNNRIEPTPNTRPSLPPTGSSYQWASPPMVDIQLSATGSEVANAHTYSMLARQDLAKFNTELFVGGSDQKDINAAWITMSRQSLSSDLLGPLNAAEYSFGDVIPVNSGFGATQNQNLGFHISNTPLNRLEENGRTNITGEIQVGWDVELYRNGILVDSRINTADGRYEFNDIELDYGANDFEIILYGPQGQIESRSESYIVDGNTTRGGEFRYRFSVVDLGESVFNVNDYIDDPANEGIQSNAVFDLGITDWLSLTSGFSHFEPNEGDPEDTYMLRINTSLGRIGLADVGVSGTSEDHQIVNANFRTRAWGTSYILSYQQQELLDSSNQKVSTDTASFSMTGQLFTSTHLPLSYQNLWQLTESNQGYRQESFQNAFGINSRLGAFNHTLTWYENIASEEQANLIPSDDTAASLAPYHQIIGGINYRKSFGRIHTRFYNNYAIKPVQDIISYGGALNIRWTPDFTSDLRYTHLQNLEQWNLGLSWRKSAFQVTGSGSYNSNDQWSVGLTLRFSLGYEPMQRRIFTSGRPIAQSGAVAVRVFEDLNMSGSYDENEPLLEDVTVKAVQGYRRAKTNSGGVAVITPLFDATQTDIVVDESTLDGPFMIRAIPGVSVAARRGFLETVELPVVKASELEGFVYLTNDDGEEEPATYVTLNLINSDGDIVTSTRSEFDGYYLFTEVLPGEYRLAVDSSYIDRRNLRLAKERDLSFTSKGDVISGVDFMLMPLQSADGHVAVAGRFDSPAMLKLYFHILRNRVGQQFVQQPFYIHAKDSDKYLLGVAYYEQGDTSEQQATVVCERMRALSVTCDTEYHKFKY